jgi:hypothetical protein
VTSRLTLYHKSDPTKSVNLADVDDAICHHFGVTPDHKDWFFYWYFKLGNLLSQGRTLSEIVSIVRNDLDHQPDSDRLPKLLAIADFLADNYTTRDRH